MLLSLITLATGCANSNSESKSVGKISDVIKINFPYSIRTTMSISASYKNVKQSYGSPEIVNTCDGYTYEIRTMEDKSKLIIIYNTVSGNIVEARQLTKLYSENDFNSIVTNSKLNDVKKVDPYTMIFENDDNTAISEHKLTNNQVLLINYIKDKNDWLVKSTSVIDDDSNFYNIIKRNINEINSK